MALADSMVENSLAAMTLLGAWAAAAGQNWYQLLIKLTQSEPPTLWFWNEVYAC